MAQKDRNRPSRNAVCPCGSGRKYKKCCGAKGVNLDVCKDWMASFLEEYVAPNVHEMRRLFQLEYLRIYDEWSLNEIHDWETDDTRKIQTFIEIADNHASVVISRYRTRFLLHALRTVPLVILGTLSGSDRSQSVMAMMMNATSAARRYGRDTSPSELIEQDGSNALQVTVQEGRELKNNLASDLALILGGAFAQQAGEAAYRLAGKGGRLARPTPVSQSGWDTFKPDNYPHIANVILPAPNVEASASILNAVAEYEKRRDVESIESSSGLLFREADPTRANSNWWFFTMPQSVMEAREIRVSYPSLDLTFVTSSYKLVPTHEHRIFDLLADFAEPFQNRFGLHHADFIDCCRALFHLVGYQTGYWQLRGEQATPKTFRCISDLCGTRDRVVSAAKHLYAAFSRAYLRAPRKSFVEGIAHWLREIKNTSADEIANVFVTRFTATHTIGPFEPVLFYHVDPALLVLDGFLMAHFFDACMRVTTMGDGPIGNLRASVFESHARNAIASWLSLTESDIPYTPGRDLIVEGVNYGDVDFAFVHKGLLFNLDMKAWQRSEKYFRGEFLAIDNRQKTLVKHLTERVDRRGKQLLELVRRERGQNLSGVLSLLCVPTVEYVSPHYAELWSGSTPRVLTPLEIVSLAKTL